MREEEPLHGERRIPGRLLLLGIGVAVLYWALESFADTLVHDQAFIERVWPDDPNELWMRFTVVALIVLSSASARLLIGRQERAERARLESERRFKQLFNQSLDALFVHDATGRIVDCNEEACRSLGYTREELLALSVRDIEANLLSDEGKARSPGQTLWERAVAAEPGKTVGVHLGRHRRKDGTEFPVEVHVGAVDYGAERMIFASARDISRHRQVEEERLRMASHASLRAEVSDAFNEGGDLESVLQRCTEAMVEHLDAAFARIWTLDEEEDVLKLRASAGIYTHTDGEHARVPVGRFKIGLIAKERAPHLTNTVPTDPRVSDKEWARREGMVAFAGYPLLVEDRLVGVVAMFAKHELQEDTTEALASVAATIAQGIERRRAEERLSEAESWFRALVENAMDLVVVERADGTLAYASPSIERILGYRPEEAVGQRARDYIHPEDREEAARAFRQALATPGVLPTRVLRYRHRDGSWRYLEVRGSNRLSDPAVGGLVFNCQDVTERRRAEEEVRRLNEELEEKVRQRTAQLRDAVSRLQESEERYRRVVEGSSDGIWDWDIRTGKVYWNDSLYGMLGLSPTEVRPDFDLFAGLIHPQDRQRVLDAIEAHLERGVRYHEEFRLRHSGGEYRVCVGRGDAQRDERGLPIRMAGSVVDITEQKLAEEVFARVREAERKRLARDLHDGVLQDLSYTAMAMEVTRVRAQGTGLEDSIRYQIEDIRRAIGDLRGAIYDLRLGEERDRPLPRLVESLVEQNRRMVPDLKFAVEVEEGFPPEPLGDAGVELLRVLQEALTNARRHSGARTVSVNLRVERGEAVVEVVDDGGGFDPSAGHVGVGLKSMHERADALGGTLTVESQPGEGTRVEIRTPLAFEGR